MSGSGSRKLLLGAVCTLLLSGCLFVGTGEVQSVGPPDAGAVGFVGRLEDDDRLVTTARVGGAPVLYVYDLIGGSWNHTATITPDPASFPSAQWGGSASVSGDTIVVTDEYSTNGGGAGFGGAVHVYDLVGGTWTRTQTITNPAPATPFANLVRVSADAMLVAEAPFCLDSCVAGTWSIYQRSGGGFAQASAPRSYQRLSVDADDGRFVVGSSWETPDLGNVVPSIQVVDATTSPPTVVFEDSRPAGSLGAFSRVGIEGDVVAYVNCCPGDDQLHIRRIDGTTTQPVTSFPLDPQDDDTPIDGLAVVPGMVLVTEPGSSDGWRAYVLAEDEWRRGTRVKTFDGEKYVDLTGSITTAGGWVAVQRNGTIELTTLFVADVEPAT